MDSKKLESYISKGYNCSQVVFAYFADDMGMYEDLAVKIATPFEMGMYKSEICGALSGAYMALGLKYGSTDMDKKVELIKKILKLNNEFEKQMGSSNCRELLNTDINTDEGMNHAIENNLLTSVCGNCITNAIKITEDIITEDSNI